ncbi:MAG TPA: hypothetical protein VEZ40_20120 [Pyrinomonadaceae bacterium]|nr:hypothetical protein [Pyrinomonadaceae bacterium]
MRKVLLAGVMTCVVGLVSVRGAGQAGLSPAPCGCAQSVREASAKLDEADEILTKPVSGVLQGATVQKDVLTGYVRRAQGRVVIPSARTAPEAAAKFLERFRRLFAPVKMSGDFRQIGETKTPSGDRITFARFIGGLPVLEDQITIFVDKSHAVTLVNNELQPLRRVSTADAKKALGETAARVAAVKCVTAWAGVKDANIRPVSEKGYFVTKDGSAILVWRVRFDTREPLAAWEALIEATSGRVLSVSNLAAYGK